jgi:hypothetical protein
VDEVTSRWVLKSNRTARINGFCKGIDGKKNVEAFVATCCWTECVPIAEFQQGGCKLREISPRT